MLRVWPRDFAQNRSGVKNYKNFLLLDILVWAVTGNVMPFIFAIGIACLAFAGEMLVSAQSVILWELGLFLV